MLIDTDCHLNHPAFEKLLPDVLIRAKAAGVLMFIVPGYGWDSLAPTAELASSFPGMIFPALGIHPWCVHNQINYEELFSFVREKDTVAIGEIGLDFSSECPPQDIQMASLIRQLDWARDFELPISIHYRKTYEPLYQVIQEHGGKIRGVSHSFSGNKQRLSKFIDLGFYVSFSGLIRRVSRWQGRTRSSAVASCSMVRKVFRSFGAAQS